MNVSGSKASQSNVRLHVFSLICPVLLHDPSAPELQAMDWRPGILIQDLLARSRIQAVLKQLRNPRPSDHHIWLLVWGSFHEVSFKPDLMGYKSSRKFNFSLVSPQNVFPNVFGKCETRLERRVPFGRQSVFSLELSQDSQFCGFVNSDLNWSIEACTSLDVVLVILELFGRSAPPVHHAAKSSLLFAGVPKALETSELFHTSVKIFHLSSERLL